MSKVLRRAALLAGACALALALAVPASADPPLSIDAGNGFRVVRVSNPENDAQWVTVAVDNHVGFLSSGDSGPEYGSAAASITDGPGAVRFQVSNLRLRVDYDVPAIPDSVTNDLFPAKTSNPRDNTPNGPGVFDACTGSLGGAFIGIYKLPLGVSGNLYDTETPATPGCNNAADFLRNPLNNVTDYAPDTSVVRARGDWVNIGVGFNGSGRLVSRAFLEVRWADGSITSHTVLSGVAAYGP